MKITALFFASACCILADNTTVLYNTSLSSGPFPTDALTKFDNTQKTGLRINIPAVPNCSSPYGTDCGAGLLNQLDGFSLNPMITACFSGAIDASTLPNGIRIYPISKLGAPVGIAQVLYDSNTNCMYAKPERVLDQHTHYLLTITDSVLDQQGKATKTAKEFKDCMKGRTPYCNILSTTISLLGLFSNIDKHLIAASIFTTLSATDWMEKAHDVVNDPHTGVSLAPGTAVYPLSSISSMTWVPQDNKPTPTPQVIPLNVLNGVEKVAFGAYMSPNFINVMGPNIGTISVTPTGGPIAPPSFLAPVSFHVFLPPAATMPPGGFPVVVYGHGLSDSQFGAPTFIASTLAAQGFATLAIEIPGHGYGAASYVTLGLTDNTTATIPTPGRGVNAPGAPIGPTDGCIVPGPVAVRDCARQAAVDLFSLVKAIKTTNGLQLNLNPSRIYYVGQSFGSTYGTLFHATEPAVKAAVLNGNGATTVATSRLSPTARPLAQFYLSGYNPGLFNVPPAPPEPYLHDNFNDRFVFWDEAPVTSNIYGLGPLQIAFEVAEWLDMNGDPLAFAPHLKTSPLDSVPAKSTLVQFAFGDLEMPNPTNSAFIRAGNLQSTSWLYRFDVAASMQPGLLGVLQPGVPYPIMPHRYLSNPTIFSYAPETSVALAAQKQVAAYFATDGAGNPNPNPFLTGVFAGKTLFELPASLPERLNYLQIQP